MSEPEQCIICLDPLPVPSSLNNGGESTETASSSSTVTDVVENIAEDTTYLDIIASLDGCEHIIHDACIRSWAQKTNTCPICRNPFHSVRVYNGVDGTAISTYTVQDKKQVAEFDVQQWLGDNPDGGEEEEETNPCPICNSTEREDVLLLCDSCDAAYHTHCIGLDHIPDGDWYCMECAHLFQLTQEPEPLEASDIIGMSRNIRRPVPRMHRGYHVRTRARLRRARRQARNAEWQGPWGQFSGRFYEMSDVDLDNHDDEDEDLENYRRFQQLDRRELQRWQQRINIAQRLGARDAFTNNIPPQISEHLQNVPIQTPTPPTIQETRDERRAWGALEQARDTTDTPNSSSRKRKVRSVTASPIEPVQEPERKLKRPRTRRLITTTNGEASTSTSSPATVATAAAATATTTTAVGAPLTIRPVNNTTTAGTTRPDGSSPASLVPGPGPALVSALLKELEPSGAQSEAEDDAATIQLPWRTAADASSPAISPTTSNHSSPRALSLTPPPLPRLNGRPTSPTLSLSTHIEPVYPPANYSPNRYSSDHSDSESRLPRHEPCTDGLRQPRPRRPHQIPHRAPDSSPTRLTITQEGKKSINDIVKTALRPHWRAQKLTTEQYAAINRDISRKLYEEVKDASALNEESKRQWESRATQEVAQAVSELSA